jgi:hypothetical protein
MRVKLVLLLLLFSATTYAQFAVKAVDKGARRLYAFTYAGTAIAHPVLTTHTPGYNVGNESEGMLLSGELYLDNRWNVEAGYYRTEVGYGIGDRTMEGLTSRIKKYFVPENIFIQPYLGAGVELNWGDGSEHNNMGFSENGSEPVYHWQETTNPRISFVPSVGCDLYLFSSLAFVIDYRFSMGVASHTNIYSDKMETMKELGDNGFYHGLNLGVKVSFPFRFTSSDGQSLLFLLFSALFDRYYE